MRVTDLRSDEQVWVPASAVLKPRGVGAPRLFRGSTNGLASGTRSKKPWAAHPHGVADPYLSFKYRSGTVNPQVFSWRAHVPRLSFVTCTTSIGGMIAGTSRLRCTLSTMRWTET
jgi:hypothetical protein